MKPLVVAIMLCCSNYFLELSLSTDFPSCLLLTFVFRLLKTSALALGKFSTLLHSNERNELEM